MSQGTCPPGSIKTESVKQEETKEAEKPKEEPKGFWARLKALFS
jgi:putative membrane protein